jgi:hypothetical protein
MYHLLFYQQQTRVSVGQASGAYQEQLAHLHCALVNLQHEAKKALNEA